MEPSVEHYRYVAAIARRLARQRNQHEQSDDLAQEAYVALLVAWPRLAELYPGGVPYAAAGNIVEWRLLDYLRHVYGRGDQQTTYARTRTLSSEYLDEHVVVVVEPAEPELLQTARLTSLIDSIVTRCAHLPQRRRVRTICEKLADGWNLEQIGVYFGVTDTRICQIVRQVRAAAA